MPRGVARRRENLHAGKQNLVPVDDVVARPFRPSHGPRRAVVPGRPELQLGSSDDDGRLREVGEAADVIDVAVGDE